jgi:hypothetical protein
MKPESRRDHLLTETVGGELVIYDELTHDAHHLNPTAAWVWRMADGERSLPNLATGLRESVTAFSGMNNAPLDDDTSEALVRMALGELDRARLLVRALPPLGDPMTRREMIGVTAALLPIIASIVAPTPAMAQTTTTTTTTSTITPTTIPPNLFAAFNGDYLGHGEVVGTSNPCDFGPSTIVTVLSVDNRSPLTNSMSIRHVTPNQTFNYVGVTMTVQNPTPNSLVVSGTSPVTAGGFQESNTLNFVRSAGVVTMNGTQTFTGSCGTFTYSITGTM